jgi:hypothetical protein
MWNTKVKVAIIIPVCAFFAWNSYYLAIYLRAANQLISESSFFVGQTQVGWWTTLFYATELIPIMGTASRWIASLLALYSAALIYRKSGGALPKIKGKVSTALLLEGFNYLTYIPVLISGFAFAFFGESLWYYGRTPVLSVVLLNGVVSLALILVLPPLLFKLRSKIAHNTPSEELLKWGSITAISYLFVFWFAYSNAWFASFVPWAERAQPGFEILRNPIDLISFVATFFGLLLVAIYGLATALPLIKKTGKPKPTRIGITMISFGAYFAIMTILYFGIGGYHAHPTTWMEILSPVHNPDSWCLSFLISGALLIPSLNKSPETKE